MRSYLGPFVLTFFIVLFIFLMQFIWKYLDDFVGKGLDGFVIAELLFYASANLVPMSLPLAVLLSSIMTMGNLAEHYELVAMKSSGLSLFKVLAPLIVFIGLLAGGAFYFNNTISPFANLKFKALLWDVTRKKPSMELKEGIFYNGIEGYSIRVMDKDKETSRLYDVLIYQHDKQTPGNRRVIRAKEGEMIKSPNGQNLMLHLKDGVSYDEIVSADRDAAPHTKNRFKEDFITMDLSGFDLQRTDEELWKSHMKMLSMRQLRDAIDSLNAQSNKRRAEMQRYMDRSVSIIDTTKIKPHISSSRTKSMQSASIPLDTTRKDSNASNTVAPLTTTRITNFNNLAPEDTAAREMALSDRDISFRASQGSTEESTLQNDSIPGSTYAKLELADRRQVVNVAMNMTRNAKNYMARSKEDISSRVEFVNKHKMEWHRKLTLSLAVILLFFIGAPLGAIIKKGGLGLPVIFSVVFFLVYHITSITGEKMVETGKLLPSQGMWLSSAILLPIALFLTYKAAKDASLFDWDVYVRMLERVGKLFAKKKVPV